MLKYIDRRVLIPASDARVVSVVDGDVQRRRRDGRVSIAVDVGVIAVESQVSIVDIEE